jgi:hypothetical protein
MALAADERQRVENAIRELLRQGPMYSHRLVKAVMQRTGLTSNRDEIAAIALRMTKFIYGGPDDGKVILK